MKIFFNRSVRAMLLIMGFTLLGLGSIQAAEDFKIVIKNHQFDPPELVVPYQKRFTVLVENQDPSAEKFYSFDLNREKVVPGNGKIVMYLGPLRAGTYKYEGYYNSKTAQGTIVAKD